MGCDEDPFIAEEGDSHPLAAQPVGLGGSAAGRFRGLHVRERGSDQPQLILQ